MDRHASRFAPPETLRRDPALKLEEATIKGPLGFLNPTQARYTHITTGLDDAAKVDNVLPDKVQYKYTSRNSRKGRHALIVSKNQPEDGHLIATPKPTNRPGAVAHGLWRMCTYFPYWDISWLVAVTFTLGSAVWVLNSFFVLLPIGWPSTEFPGEVLYGGGITAFIGVNIFEIGSILLMLEAFNENRSDCFGWAVEKLCEGKGEGETGAVVRIKPISHTCPYHTRRPGKAFGPPAETGISRTPTDLASAHPEGDYSWIWWPSSHKLRKQHLHNLGFWACSIQMLAATIFYISGITALPGIIDNMSQPLLDVFYWTPQVIGGFGFVISGLLFMVETQRHWWWPALDIIGWHIGFWNWIGGVGFLICPCFGYMPAEWAQFQAAIATFWGSWAFLIGSLIQWYESIEKHPVEVRTLKPPNRKETV